MPLIHLKLSQPSTDVRMNIDFPPQIDGVILKKFTLTATGNTAVNLRNVLVDIPWIAPSLNDTNTVGGHVINLPIRHTQPYTSEVMDVSMKTLQPFLPTQYTVRLLQPTYDPPGQPQTTPFAPGVDYDLHLWFEYEPIDG